MLHTRKIRLNIYIPVCKWSQDSGFHRRKIIIVVKIIVLIIILAKASLNTQDAPEVLYKIMWNYFPFP